MIDFTKVEQVLLTRATLKQTQTWLQEAGKTNDESFVLWAGSFKANNIFYIETEIFPEQKAFKTASGIGVYVSGDELFKINKWLYENQQILIAQIHSHPSKAYHSNTDDSFPLVTCSGQFSIVVPYFARAPLINLLNCAVYRLCNNNWKILNKIDINSIFRVVE